MTQKSIAYGAPLKGYTFWVLLGKFERVLGCEKCFGFAPVNFETLERAPKASYHALATPLKA
ncbi:MAG: family 1 glycosylhydrolase [Litoreibacter sp.]|uniref:family 1 glycosylhydrolase n=1 Tax=Litoreibacter sp. TaxID=1969459 RepID=UPI003296DF50